MNVSRPLAILICPLLLAACSSDPKRPALPEGYLATHVEEDGTRVFQYTVDADGMESPAGGDRPGGVNGHVAGSSSRGLSGGVSLGTGGRNKPPSGGSAAPRHQGNPLEQELERSFEAALARSGFCAHGHEETQRETRPPTLLIRGTCTTSHAPGDELVP